MPFRLSPCKALLLSDMIKAMVATLCHRKVFYLTSRILSTVLLITQFLIQVRSSAPVALKVAHAETGAE